MDVIGLYRWKGASNLLYGLTHVKVYLLLKRDKDTYIFYDDAGTSRLGFVKFISDNWIKCESVKEMFLGE